MTGIKLARIRRCHECPHRFTRHATVNGWPQCDFAGDGFDLGDEFMEGEATNCPAGYWLELTPVDMEAEAVAAKGARLEKQRERVAPFLRKALASVTDAAAKEQLLIDAVSEGMAMPELAEELAVEEGLNLDAELA